MQKKSIFLRENLQIRFIFCIFAFGFWELNADAKKLEEHNGLGLVKKLPIITKNYYDNSC